jgi:N-acyl-D-amino-acid deacylase
MRQSAILLMILGTSLSRGAEVAPDAVRQAIEKGLRRLDTGAGNYIRNRQCFSCHHQALTIAALESARRRGFAVGEPRLRQQVEFTLNTFRPRLARVARGEAVPGGNTTAAYALFTLEAAGHEPDAVTGALVDYLLVRQRPDGSWPAQMDRPPSEGSVFTNNALALRGLKRYGIDERKVRAEAAFDKGRDWLRRNRPVTTEDRVFQLRALVSAGEDRKAVEAARGSLVAEQRPDGSWAQLPRHDGDAYATGTALTALCAAGACPTEPAVQKGIAYLLKNQREDGAWIVTTRSRPVQVFFDNGDPGGKSQFISFAATGWATLALLELLPADKPALGPGKGPTR